MRTRCILIGSAAAAMLAFGLTGCATRASGSRADVQMGARKGDMQLGNFSVSLSVKDLAKSREFYEKLGFVVRGGDAAQNWLILQNGTATIGLFQGMFEKNTLTFNPGWDNNAKALAEFEDVRDIQRRLRESGIEFVLTADESTTGPAYFIVEDPDGNPVLVDQHVPKGGKGE